MIASRTISGTFTIARCRFVFILMTLMCIATLLMTHIVYAANRIGPEVITVCKSYKFAPMLPGDDLIEKHCEGALYGDAWETYGCGPHDFIAEWKGDYLLVIIANHCQLGWCCWDSSCCGSIGCSICVKYTVCCTYS